MIKIMTKIKISKLIFIFQIRDQDLYPAMLLSTIERQNHCFRTSYVISHLVSYGSNGLRRPIYRFSAEDCLPRPIESPLAECEVGSKICPGCAGNHLLQACHHLLLHLQQPLFHHALRVSWKNSLTELHLFSLFRNHADDVLVPVLVRGELESLYAFKALLYVGLNAQGVLCFG